VQDATPELVQCFGRPDCLPLPCSAAVLLCLRFLLIWLESPILSAAKGGGRTDLLPGSSIRIAPCSVAGPPQHRWPRPSSSQHHVSLRSLPAGSSVALLREQAGAAAGARLRGLEQRHLLWHQQLLHPLGVALQTPFAAPAGAHRPCSTHSRHTPGRKLGYGDCQLRPAPFLLCSYQGWAFRWPHQEAASWRPFPVAPSWRHCTSC